jgi:hypothetical protein
VETHNFGLVSLKSAQANSLNNNEEDVARKRHFRGFIFFEKKTKTSIPPFLKAVG